MKVLITGGAGNVGSVLSGRLLAEGYEVVALDVLWFEKTAPLAHLNHPRYSLVRGDIRDSGAVREALAGVSFVVHAAAVVGDAACSDRPDLAREINDVASRDLVSSCLESGVRGLFFLSTCSNYGAVKGAASEETELNPLSLYAETKVSVERFLIEEVRDLDWVIGRCSTVYGPSPRMRFDLTVNDFVMTAMTTGSLDIYRPDSYRPYIHTWDLASVIHRMIESFEEVKNRVFNLGFGSENYRKIEIAEIVRRHLPETEINILVEGGDDRDYQVDFSRLESLCGGHREYDVDASVGQILHTLRSGVISDPRAPMYYNTSPDLE